MVRELLALVDGFRAGKGRNRWRGQVVDGAAKNPLSVGHQQQNFVQQAQRIRP